MTVSGKPTWFSASEVDAATEPSRSSISASCSVAVIAVMLRSARVTGSAHRRPPGSAPWPRWAARCGPHRQPKTAGRRASSRLRSGAMLFSIDGPVTMACAAARRAAARTGRHRYADLDVHSGSAITPPATATVPLPLPCRSSSAHRPPRAPASSGRSKTGSGS